MRRGPEPHTPSPFTHRLRVYSILIHTGKGGGGGVSMEPERWLEGQYFTKMGRKYQYDRLYLQSIISVKSLYKSII
jgi:hypothetical protein